MIDTRLEVINGLKTIGLPVYAEHFICSDTDAPCISYRLTNDIQEKTGENIMYGSQYYSIKLYSRGIKDTAEYGKQIDKVMREMGFTRIATNHTWITNYCLDEFKYLGKTIEYMEE